MTRSARIQTSFFVDGLVRSLNQAGFPCYITQKGYESSGALYVMVELPERKGRIFTRTHDYVSGEVQWSCPVGEMEVTLEISDLNAYTQRLKERDPDCWIMEVEDFQNKLGIPYQNDFWPE